MEPNKEHNDADTPLLEEHSVVVPPSPEESASSQPSHENTQSPVQPAPIFQSTPTPTQAPQNPTPPTNQNVVQPTSPGVVVLQWLTYAFWGWTILALIYLVGITANFSLSSNQGDTTPDVFAYGIAAIIVLVPISFICDVIYSKREAEHKHGASMAIMVIHAVIFALLGIAAIITIAFSIVSLLLSPSFNNGILAAIITAAVAVILYGLMLLRTVRPFKPAKYRFLFRLLVLVLVLIVTAWGVLGPIVQASRTKDDRAVRQALQDTYSMITSYTSTNNKLPASLDTLLSSSAASNDGSVLPTASIQDLANRHLISYSPNTTPTITALNLSGTNTTGKDTLYYTICGTFKYAHSGSSRSTGNADALGYNYSYSGDESNTVGKNCYKIETAVYNY